MVLSVSEVLGMVLKLSVVNAVSDWWHRQLKGYVAQGRIKGGSDLNREKGEVEVVVVNGLRAVAECSIIVR